MKKDNSCVANQTVNTFIANLNDGIGARRVDARKFLSQKLLECVSPTATVAAIGNYYRSA